jgi:ribokinase
VSARVGVVGHVEWVQFVELPALPERGAIAHAVADYRLAAGGGMVAAVHLARLAGEATFFTALGDDEGGLHARELAASHGLDLYAAPRPGASTRRAITFVDGQHERTITLLDPRLVPHGADDLPWELLAPLDGVYFTNGDAAAVRAAGAARVLVATARVHDVLAEAGVELDALVASASDRGEQGAAAELDPQPRLVVRTDGERGGTWTARDGSSGSWEAAPLPAGPADSYGCGDAFAAGLTFALAQGLRTQDAVLLGAECGARCLTLRGPYG